MTYVLIVEAYAEQTFRLIQPIYRRWNLYCIVYDNDTNYELKQTFMNLNVCFDNIILLETFIDINRADFSILNSIMNCMKVLYSHVIEWRYVQILSWNDFPWKTNAKMVKIMQIFNGSQDTELVQCPTSRFRFYHRDVDKEHTLDENKKNLKKSIPPGHIVIYKGR